MQKHGCFSLPLLLRLHPTPTILPADVAALQAGEALCSTTRPPPATCSRSVDRTAGSMWPFATASSYFTICTSYSSRITSTVRSLPLSLYLSKFVNLATMFLHRLHAAVLLLCASTSLSQHLVSYPESACQAIASKFVHQDVTVNFAQYIPAGTNITLQQDVNLVSCERPSQVVPVDLCRVAMLVKTSNISNITLESWLPTNWTGRFLSTGNGGTSGK